MIRKKAFYSLIVTALSVMTFLSCQGGITGNGISVEDSASAVLADDVDTTAEMVMDDTVDNGQPDLPAEEIPEARPEKKKQTVAPSHGGKETLYISTYGANGKVWGHVTMNGKTGHGTIHDEDENSYSISVTRHGGELYGTDQNGRQYVFRL